MKRNKIMDFMKRKDVLVATSFCLVAVVALVGIAVTQHTNEVRPREEQFVDLDEVPNLDGVARWPVDEDLINIANNTTNRTNERILTQEEVEERLAANNDLDVPEEMLVNVEEVVDVASMAVETDAMPVISFSETTILSWPIEGNVIIDYSMDSSVYFSTLDQYKYNPALIISAEVNGQVKAVATGTVVDISSKEETGQTLTMELGDGYRAIYGQLKEIPAAVGDTINEGTVIGYISEPTKYFSIEGSNLYFKLEKDGVPVDPMSYLP
jgi:Membrane-bound metallopeptidase